MATVKADGTVIHSDGTRGRLTPQEMDHRRRYNEWVRLPEDRRSQTPPPPLQHNTRAGLMQKYIDPVTEREIAERLRSGGAGGGGGLLDGLRR